MSTSRRTRTPSTRLRSRAMRQMLWQEPHMFVSSWPRTSSKRPSWLWGAVALRPGRAFPQWYVQGPEDSEKPPVLSVAW